MEDIDNHCPVFDSCLADQLANGTWTRARGKAIDAATTGSNRVQCSRLNCHRELASSNSCGRFQRTFSMPLGKTCIQKPNRKKNFRWDKAIYVSTGCANMIISLQSSRSLTHLINKVMSLKSPVSRVELAVEALREFGV
jgi:hypothetical protein